MRHCIFSVVLALSMISMSERGLAQSNTWPWPMSGAVGIGTTVTKNALNISFNSDIDTAIIRLTNDTSSTVFAILGLMPPLTPYTNYSSISTGQDLIIHEHSQGDIILTNYQSTSLSHPYGAIRFATTPSPSSLPLIAPPPHDVERLTINPNGNIGIDLPPDTGIFAGLGNPMDQLQIGGGSIPPPGYTSAIPGLTLYGGNRFEGMLESSGGLFPVDWRYIAFNQYTNHSDTSTTRSKRIAPMSSSAIAFAANDNTNDGGMIDLHCIPYDSTTGLNDDTAHGINFHLMGNKGLQLWCDISQADVYHHILDILRPGYIPSGITRNTNGLSYFHTPLYIGSDAGGSSLVDFTNLTNVRPNIGDDSTWTLAVNGAALFKEAWVNSSDWPDYVFERDFKLMSIEEFGNYIRANHHLPELPDAKTMNNCVPLGQTEKGTY